MADCRKHVRLERGKPLRTVFGILERGTVRGVHFRRRFTVVDDTWTCSQRLAAVCDRVVLVVAGQPASVKDALR